MKILFNNKGIALIILIIAMTLISLLGAGIVSFMGAKQRSYPFQVNSYRALNIANAGVEYAIRFASDGLDTNGNSIFFSNPTLTTLGKSFSGGNFTVSYVYNQMITSDLLTVIGTYGGSSRQVRLSNFRRYISPITLVPGNNPRINPMNINQTLSPIICNNESIVSVTRMDLTLGSGNKYLQYIIYGVTNVFDYTIATGYPVCGGTPTNGCLDPAQGVFLGSGSPVSFNISLSHSPDTINTYTFQFSNQAPTGRYTIDFYTSLPAGNPFTIIFSL